jgi:hypothetical protein
MGIFQLLQPARSLFFIPFLFGYACCPKSEKAQNSDFFAFIGLSIQDTSVA